MENSKNKQTRSLFTRKLIKFTVISLLGFYAVGSLQSVTELCQLKMPKSLRLLPIRSVERSAVAVQTRHGFFLKEKLLSNLQISMQEKLEDAHKFKLWKSNLIANGLIINKIDEHYTRHRYNGEVLFSLLMLDAETPEGDKIPPICFLKGEVVCILVCLINKITKEKYLLLVKQRRIAEGGFTYEHPAGMVDGTMTPLAIAVQEVREETGLEVTESQLIDLSPEKRVFPSTGTSDEAIYLYACEIEMTSEEMEALSNKEMGTAYEFERITTHVVPFLEGHRLINNSNAILLNYMYLTKVGDFELLKKLV